MGANWSSRPQPDTGLDDTLRRLVVVFQLLGWVWMLLLVIVTLVVDDGANAGVVLAAMVTATLWTVAVVVVARRTQYLGTWWFVGLGGLVALWIGSATTIAGADDLFHGGFVIAWIVLAAYAGGRLAALSSAALITVEQIIVHIVDVRGIVPATGSINFFIFAYIVGWTVDSLRHADTERSAAVAALAAQQESLGRLDERTRLADQIHDTVLQTLHAIALNADHPNEVRYLARKQERELRRAIAALQSPHDRSLRVALLTARDEVEDMYRVEIKPVLRIDAEMNEGLSAVVDTAREAMLNAAAHSGSTEVDLFSEEADETAIVNVRDRGTGFDPGRLSPHRGLGRCIARLSAVGGRARVESTIGSGTNVTIEASIR